MYPGWAALKPKVIKICVAYQAAVILIGSTTLSRNFVIIIVPSRSLLDRRAGVCDQPL